MKKEGHPEYRQVLFVDSSAGYQFVCGSALQTKETAQFEGKEYPVCQVSISSASHPLFTGEKQYADTEGRLDKFNKRYGDGKKKKQSKDASSEE